MRISTSWRSAKRLRACDAPSRLLQSKCFPATVCTWRSLQPSARAAARIASHASCTSSGSSPQTVYTGARPRFRCAARASLLTCMPVLEHLHRGEPAHHLGDDVGLHRPVEERLFLLLGERRALGVGEVALLQDLARRDQLLAAD